MPYSMPSIAGLRDLVSALGRALFPELSFGSRRSYHGKKATYLAGAVGHLAGHAASAQRDLHPLTAGEGKPLDDWCRVVGIERKGATPARRAAAGRVRGSGGSTVAVGSQLRHPPTGKLFKIANLTPVTIPGPIGTDGFFDADIAGVDTGSVTRLAAGETLTFLSSPAGIEDDVILQLPLDQDGFDEEAFGSQRQRFLATFSQPRAGGTDADFKAWALESIPQVAKAFVYPRRGGRGSVDVAVFYNGDGAARVLSSDDRTLVLDHIKTKAPFQVGGENSSLRVLLTVPDPQRIEILITPDGREAFRFDWQGVAEVASYNATNRQLVFAAPLPASLRPAHRIILVGDTPGSGANAQDGRQYRVESIVNSTTVVLAVPAPITPPAAGDIIYPGGPLVEPIRAAIRAHVNGEIVYAGKGKVPIPESVTNAPGGPSPVGLDILADGMGSSNPGRRYGTWAGGLFVSTLFGIATYKAGVGDAQILFPTANYMPLDDPFPNQAQIHYVSPGPIIVRSV